MQKIIATILPIDGINYIGYKKKTFEPDERIIIATYGDINLLSKSKFIKELKDDFIETSNGPTHIVNVYSIIEGDFSPEILRFRWNNPYGKLYIELEYNCRKCENVNNVHACCENGSYMKPFKNDDGIIYAEIVNQNQNIHLNNDGIKPVYITVDIAMTDRANVLLGRKHGETGWRFIGGFVDKTDNSILDAAKRELSEEVSTKTLANKLMTDDWKIIDTPVNLNTLHHNINEPIFNVFYSCKYISGVLEANDDIEEIKWHPFNEINKIEFVDAHKNLKRLFYNYIKI